MNPTAEAIHSIRCHRSIKDISGPVDLAIVTVAKDQVLAVVEACGKNGVRGLIVITAGFKEIAADGAALESSFALSFALCLPDDEPGDLSEPDAGMAPHRSG